MHPKKIWANLAVSDLDRTTRFYTSLGFKHNGMAKELTSFLFGNNDFVIHFFIKDHLCFRRLLKVADVISAPNLEVVIYLCPIVELAVIHRKVPREVKEFPAVRFPVMRMEISLILEIMASFHSETRVDVGGKQLTIQRLDADEKLVHRIGLIVDLFIGDSSLIAAFLCKKGALEDREHREKD